VAYAETAALYETMDLAHGGRSEGLTDDELRKIVRAFGVQTTLV
jgi:rhamnulose-1-phosphate aldolase